jgi:hypothetical protein
VLRQAARRFDDTDTSVLEGSTRCWCCSSRWSLDLPYRGAVDDQQRRTIQAVTRMSHKTLDNIFDELRATSAARL